MQKWHEPAYLVTCEHAAPRVPAAYRHLFRTYAHLLPTHRGYDAGALRLARGMARRLDAPLLFHPYTRLLIDANRSPGHPALYSEVTRSLPEPLKQQIAARHHAPYWRRVFAAVARAAADHERVVHVSVHSFTPMLAGVRRRAEIGVLYDPARPGEVRLATALVAAFRRYFPPPFRIRRNYPYLGRSDSLVRSLRQTWPAGQYIGVELEFNQALWDSHGDECYPAF